MVSLGVGIAQCINTYDALRSLGIDPVVVTTGLCYGTPMTAHMRDIDEEGDFPDGLVLRRLRLQLLPAGLRVRHAHVRHQGARVR